MMNGEHTISSGFSNTLSHESSGKNEKPIKIYPMYEEI